MSNLLMTFEWDLKRLLNGYQQLITIGRNLEITEP